MKLNNFLMCHFLTIFVFNQRTVSSKHKSLRLPRSVIPEAYELEIIASLKFFIYNGKVTITLRCEEDTNEITLHSRNLTIQEIKACDLRTKNPIAIKKYEVEEEFDFLRIYLGTDLIKNQKYKFEIRFQGNVVDGMTGFYRSHYREKKSNRKKWMGTTQFEPTNARYAFPCFDEPDLKATFQIRIGHEDRLIALSNMHIINTTSIVGWKGWVLDHFAESKNMSTYLVAFVICDFAHVDTEKKNQFGTTAVKMWAPRDSIHQIEFAKEISPKIISFFENYFYISYPYSKMDLVAIPDFAAGAMENWGLITFRESRLLFTPGVSDLKSKEGIATIIAHEVAHMWFGNLVTMKWWNDLWLKEGFATYLARVAVEKQFPDWNDYSLSSVFNAMLAVYGIDIFQAGRPISITITEPGTIHEIFDGITYQKGSCVIRMMEIFLGDTILRQGLTNYLAKFKWSNAEQDDLWNILSEVAHESNTLPKEVTVTQIMNSWTNQPGFPVITVTRNKDVGAVTITQQRFFRNIKTTNDTCYWIPLTYTVASHKNFNVTKPELWMPCPKKSIIVDIDPKEKWFIFNVQATGLYKVNYDSANWQCLINQLEKDPNSIAPLNRAILIDDIMELALAGHVEYHQAINMIRYLRFGRDKEEVVWQVTLKHWRNIRCLMYRTPQYGLLLLHIKSLVSHAYNHLSHKIQDSTESTTFSTYERSIISTACSSGYKQCREDIKTLFQLYLDNPGKNSIPNDIREIVYCIGIEEGDEELWNKLWDHYLKSRVANEKSTILSALGCSKQLWVLIRYMEMIIQKKSGIRNQEALRVFRSMVDNPVAFYSLRIFFYAHIQEFYNIQSPKGKNMPHYLQSLIRTMKTKREVSEFKIFMRENTKYFHMAQLKVQQVLEELDIVLDWHENHYHNVVAALEPKR